MIRQPSYEVGPEFVDRFTAADPANATFFTASTRGEHSLFDLPGYIAMRLERAGIAQDANNLFLSWDQMHIEGRLRPNSA